MNIENPIIKCFTCLTFKLSESTDSDSSFLLTLLFPEANGDRELERRLSLGVIVFKCLPTF